MRPRTANAVVKFLFIGGLVLAIGGLLGAVLVPVLGAFDAVSSADDDAAKHCNAGERLIKFNGLSQRGSGTINTYYCQDASGVRRDISNEVSSDTKSSVFKLGAAALALLLVSMAGFGMIAAGVVVGIRRGARRLRAIVPAGVSGGQPFGLNLAGAEAPPANPPETGNLIARLKEADAARRAGLLTQEEYDALRARIVSGE